MNARVGARVEDWPIAGEFVIARGAKSSVRVVVASVEMNGVTGRGECAPYARYGETPERTRDEILSQASLLRACGSIAQMRDAINAQMQPGAARNAVDCALWDLEARTTGVRVWRLARLSRPAPVLTAYTIGLGSPDEMARAAAQARYRPLLKLKLGGDDEARIAAVRIAAPNARLIVDANEIMDDGDMARERRGLCRSTGRTHRTAFSCWGGWGSRKPRARRAGMRGRERQGRGLACGARFAL